MFNKPVQTVRRLALPVVALLIGLSIVPVVSAQDGISPSLQVHSVDPDPHVEPGEIITLSGEVEYDCGAVESGSAPGIAVEPTDVTLEVDETPPWVEAVGVEPDRMEFPVGPAQEPVSRPFNVTLVVGDDAPAFHVDTVVLLVEAERNGICLDGATSYSWQVTPLYDPGLRVGHALGVREETFDTTTYEFEVANEGNGAAHVSVNRSASTDAIVTASDAQTLASPVTGDDTSATFWFELSDDHDGPVTVVLDHPFAQDVDRFAQTTATFAECFCRDRPVETAAGAAASLAVPGPSAAFALVATAAVALWFRRWR